jgi:hypothetical protein
MADKTGVESVASGPAMTGTDQSMIVGDNTDRTSIRNKVHVPVRVHNEPVLIGNTL